MFKIVIVYPASRSLRALDFDRSVLVERYIQGRELTVGVLDGSPMPPIEIVPDREFFDYEAKYYDSHTKYLTRVNLAAPVERRLADVAARVFEVIGCRQMARVDFIYGTDGEVYVLEINTIPGMTERSLLPMAARMIGLDFAGLCDHLVCDAYNKVQAHARITSFEEVRMRQVG